MALYDFPASVRPETPGLKKIRRPNLVGHNQPFKVAHQKVSLKIDKSSRSIEGSTELTIVPTDPGNRIIKLDARYMEIDQVYVNDRKVNYLYNDYVKLQNEEVVEALNRIPAEDNNIEEIESNFFWKSEDKLGIHQHKQIKDKSRKLFAGGNTQELAVFLPDKMKITLQEAGGLSAFTPIMRDSPGSVKTPGVGDLIYTPLCIKIEYKCKNPKDGVIFSDDMIYTQNRLLAVSTSSWVPCVDSLWERSTWSIELEVDMAQDLTEDAEPQNVTVCCGDIESQNETFFEGKKMVSFDLPNPVAAHHVGWAVGFFDSVSMESLQETEEQEEESNDTTGTTVNGAILFTKDQKEAAVNTCVALPAAMEYFSHDFGSYPFSSYSIVFVDDLAVDYCSFAGITIASSSLLYKPEIIDPLLDRTELLAGALSRQWAGVNVIQKTLEDTWCVVGMQLYMAHTFVHKLMGWNEYKFRAKKRAEQVCKEDVNQRALADPIITYPVDETKDFWFLALKAPIVLFILNRRMTKTDKSYGLSRVFRKLFLEAMSGDLPNGALDTAHFQYVVEKVYHNKLEVFFKQWVYGCGTPIFRVTQRFNKKRMFIEMGIRQVQLEEARDPSLRSDTFLDNGYKSMKTSKPVPTIFTGPITIRIHEADGTPYEHIVHLKDAFTKLDIQYNTKYRRLKRRQTKQLAQQESEFDGVNHDSDLGPGNNAASLGNGMNDAEDDQQESADTLVHCLGDVLQTPEDIQKWKLSEWSKAEEERMGNEAFEWIRVDADFEWICTSHISQPDYMYLSQLQQDRDVEAQLESVYYFKETPQQQPVYATILLRTLMDSRYYYGVRIAAAEALARYTSPKLQYVGQAHLVNAFKTLFCYEKKPTDKEDSPTIPLPNDFSDFQLYFLQKAMVRVLAQVRTENGCPNSIKRLLVDLLRYNENASNDFDDCYYMGQLVYSATEGLLSSSENSDDLLSQIISELDRCLKKDEWVPSHERQLSVSVLDAKTRLAVRKSLDIGYEDFLPYTRPENHVNVRIAAFKGILLLGGLKNAAFLRYFFKTLQFDESNFVKDSLLQVLCEVLGEAVLHGCGKILDDEEYEKDSDLLEDPKDPGIPEIEFIEEDSAVMQSKRKDELDKTSLQGLINIARREYGIGEGIKKEIWMALHSPVLSIYHKRLLFQLCEILFENKSQMLVRLPVPRDKMLVARNNSGKITIFRQSKFKLSFNKKISLKILTKLNDSNSPRSPKIVIGSKTKVKVQKSRASNLKTLVKIKLSRENLKKLGV